MTRLLLDTCVISHMIAAAPPESFARWMKTVDPAAAAVSVVTVAEIRFGLARLPEGARKEALQAAVATLFGRMSVSPLSQVGAETVGAFLAKAERAGRPMSFTDAAIAATAVVEGRRLVTRDADFAPLGLDLLNPWKAP